MSNKRKNILIKSISLLILVIIFITMNYNASFAKILTINWDELEFFIPNSSQDLSRDVQDGAYIISCSGNENMVLDVEEISLDNTANVHIWQRTGGLNQRFYISYVGNGYYKITSINSGKVLDVDGASTESGANVHQYENNNSSAQRWKIVKNEDGTYTFIAECSEKALDVNGAIYENGTNVQQYDSNNTNAQRFKLEKVEMIDEGISSIRSVSNTGMLLDVINCSADEGTQVHVWQEAATLAQRYEIHRVGENEVRIRTAASGGWLKEKEAKEGAEVIQSGNSNTEASDSDTWKVEWDDGLVFVNKESGLALNIAGDLNQNGTMLEVNTKSNSNTQKFVLHKENLIPTGYFTIQSKYGTMLDFPNNNQGTHLQTWIETGTSRQVFEISCQSDGYKIKSPTTGYVLDVYDGSMLNAATVQMEIDVGTRSQRWIPQLLDGGYIALKNLNSGMALNVHFANKEPGAVVNQGIQDNGEPQQWKLVPTQLNEFTNAWGDDWHTDKVYLAGIIDRANRVGSDTDWFIAVDVGKFRVTLLHKVNNMWMVDGCFNATMGNMNDGTGRSCTGLYNMNGLAESNWQVTHKLELCNGNLRWFVAYIDHYKYVNGNRVEDSQGFHNHYEDAGQSFSSGGCPRLTDEHAKYLYDNIPIGTRVHIWHEY